MCRSAPAERSLLHNLAASQRLQTSHQTRGELLLIQPDYNPVQLLSPTGKLLREGSTQHDAEVSNSSNHLHDYRWTIYTTLLCFFRQLMDWCFLAGVHLPHACSKPTLSDWWNSKVTMLPKNTDLSCVDQQSTAFHPLCPKPVALGLVELHHSGLSPVI